MTKTVIGFDAPGECAFCDRVLRSKTGAQYHVQIAHGAEIAFRIRSDQQTRRDGEIVHPYVRARESL